MRNFITVVIILIFSGTVLPSCKKANECTECHNPYGSSVVCPEPNGCVICRSSYGSNSEYQTAISSYKQGGYDCKVKK